MSVAVSMSTTFFESLAKLTPSIQKKINKFLTKFMENPKGPSINYEQLKCIDSKLQSARVDLSYRIILMRDDESDTYVLLWVDHHDEAYHWAENKKIDVNSLTGKVQLYDVESSIIIQDESYLFDDLSDKQLIELLVPESQIKMVRSIKDLESFYRKKSAFSNDTYELLEMYLDGTQSFDDLSEFAKSLYENNTPTKNVSEAIRNQGSTDSFTIVENADEMLQALEYPLEKWRVFLHPSQRKLVQKHYNGPSRVCGGAGTGKTVVAMHRAKELANNEDAKILFTTFTTNLVGDVKANLSKICSFDQIQRISVNNIDSIICKIFSKISNDMFVKFESNDNVWNQAKLDADNGLDLSIDFYRNEWEEVATTMDNLDIENYLRISRVGRGIRLNRQERLKVWHVFEEYMNIVRKTKVCDIDYATYICRKYLINHPEMCIYSSIIVDEGQDIGINGYKFIRALSGEEHEDDIFIVGDAHQRIYNKKTVLSKCGINIKGKSNILKINYRTTAETQKYAYNILKGLDFDDLDGGKDDSISTSLTHGDNPQFENYLDENEQFENMLQEVSKLSENGAKLSNICIAVRNNIIADSIEEKLRERGVKTYKVSKEKYDDLSQDGLRIATMHRIKGLEFQYVFVLSANKDIIPQTNYIPIQIISKEENLKLERCLLYVAMTRAQKKAFIYSYGKKSELI